MKISNLPKKIYLRIENYGLPKDPEDIEDFEEIDEDRMFWMTERGCEDDVEYVLGSDVEENELKNSASVSKEGWAVRIGNKTALYAAFSEYAKTEDDMLIPPLLKNWMIGFIPWLLQRTPESFIPLNYKL